MVQIKDAVNYSFRQKFEPSKNGVRWNIDWKETATAREQVCYQMAFQDRGVGNFPLNGGTGHLGVVISWLVGERARESGLQTSISGGGADGFSDATSGRNMFRTRRVCNSLRDTGSRPSLLYSPGVERKGRDEILRGKGNSVGAVAIVRRVDNQGDVIHKHFVDIKDNTSVSVTTEWVPANDGKDQEWGWEDLNSGRGGAG